MNHTSHRTASVLTACIMSAVCIATVLPEATASAAEKKMLVLGDSISAGYGLANGELGYYDYVAEYGGYSMTNLAVSGDTTVDLLEVIAKDNTQKAVKDADLICISIGGNDLLQAVQGYTKRIIKHNAKSKGKKY